MSIVASNKRMTHSITRPKAEDQMGRLFGLGKKPQELAGTQGLGQVATQALSCGFSQIPMIEYVKIHVELPLHDQDITNIFGDEIDLMTFPRNVPGVTAVDSSFAINGILQVDMVAVGYGVHVKTAAQSCTILGNAINPAPVPGAINVSPDSYTTNDIVSGSLGTSLGSGGVASTSASISPALLEVGAPAWNAAWNLCEGYQFNWIVCQRYALVQEMLGDVVYRAPSDMGAAGTSNEDAQRFARLANDRYQQLGYLGAFVPVNAQRVGSVSTPNAPAVTNTNHGIFHPTRAYDEAPVTWDYNGGNTSGLAYRRLCRPVCIDKGSPINMKLVAQDAYFQQEFQRYLSITDGYGGGSNNALVGFSSLGGGVTAQQNNAFLELTMDATPVTVAQQVNTDRTLMKQGSFEIGVYIKGFEICSSWATQMPGLISQGVIASPTT